MSPPTSAGLPLAHPTAVPLAHPTAVPLAHPTAVPLAHPTAHPAAVPAPGASPPGPLARWWPAARWVLHRAGVVVLSLVVFVLVSEAGRPTVAAHGPGDPAAAAAVAALAGGGPRAGMPADFAATMGYWPVREAGRLVDPSGACSSPVPLPGALTAACRAHDLGYDLLRYAERRHHPLGAWARQAIDARFARDADDRCAGAPGCRVMAWVAAVVVDVNTWRQGASVPVVESPWPSVLGGLAALAVAALAVAAAGAAGAATVVRERR